MILLAERFGKRCDAYGVVRLIVILLETILEMHSLSFLSKIGGEHPSLSFSLRLGIVRTIFVKTLWREMLAVSLFAERKRNEYD